MAVSDVGRMAIWFSRSESPLHPRQYFLTRSRGTTERFGDPCNFSFEAFYVICFRFQSSLRNEHREIAVLNAKLLDLRVKPALVDELHCKQQSRFSTLYEFPDRVRPRTEDVASGDVFVVLDQFRFLDHLTVPFGEIFLFADSDLHFVFGGVCF